jgi:hypothetical protein
MANYSAAFGYDFYIVPVQNALVTDFETAPNLDVSTPVASDATVTYTGGVFTIGGSAYTMDGTDGGIRLASLTNASLETDTGSEEIYTYDDETKGFLRPLLRPRASASPWLAWLTSTTPAYKVLRLTEQNTVADGLRVASLASVLPAPLRPCSATAP